MTLKEIIAAVQSRTHRRINPEHIRGYANYGTADIVSHIKVYLSEWCILRESFIDIYELSHSLISVLDVKDEGVTSVPFEVQTASAYIIPPQHVQRCMVIYRYVPHAMAELCNKPDIPDELHELVMLYVIARVKARKKTDDAESAMKLYETERDKMAVRSYIKSE